MSFSGQAHQFDRPPIGAEYIAPDGERVTVAATWECGVVFHGERLCSAHELQTLYTPAFPNSLSARSPDENG